VVRREPGPATSNGSGRPAGVYPSVAPGRRPPASGTAASARLLRNRIASAVARRLPAQLPARSCSARSTRGRAPPPSAGAPGTPARLGRDARSARSVRRRGGERAWGPGRGSRPTEPRMPPGRSPAGRESPGRRRRRPRARRRRRETRPWRACVQAPGRVRRARGGRRSGRAARPARRVASRAAGGEPLRPPLRSRSGRGGGAAAFARCPRRVSRR
jgi:hypothetical protein